MQKETVTPRKRVKKESTTAVAVKTEQGSSVEALLSQAVASGASVETMERLFSLREKVRAEQAKEQFIEAMAMFQKACPTIEKKKAVLNKNGTVRYMYAPLDSIVAQIRNPIADNHLAYTWDTAHENSHMKVTCKVTHSMGHFETSTLEIPIGDGDFMTAPQKYASAQTYAKRYTLLNALGIATADEDTDATDVNKEKEALNPKAKIQFCLRQLKEKNATKEEVEEAVKRLTGLALDEKNYETIVERLESIIKENYEGTTIR